MDSQNRRQHGNWVEGVLVRSVTDGDPAWAIRAAAAVVESRVDSLPQEDVQVCPGETGTCVSTQPPQACPGPGSPRVGFTLQQAALGCCLSLLLQLDTRSSLSVLVSPHLNVRVTYT